MKTMGWATKVVETLLENDSFRNLTSYSISFTSSINLNVVEVMLEVSGKCFKNAWKSNFTAKSLNTFVAHVFCAIQVHKAFERRIWNIACVITSFHCLIWLLGLLRNFISLTGFFHFCEFPVLPVAVYPFNNETLANDVSPHKAVGELVGTTFSPGIHGEPGGSIEVQGRDDSYIELRKDAGNLNIKLSITILLYVYPLGSPGPIVNYRRDGHGVQIYETAKALAARVIQRNDGRKLPVETDRLQRDQWHFIGMTYNYSSGLVKLWQDGREVAVRYIKSIQIATQFDVRIGARQMVNDNDSFSGRVACLQFYSTALTQREIEKARIACEPCK